MQLYYLQAQLFKVPFFFTTELDKTLIYVLAGVGILAFLGFALLGLILIGFWTMKVRAKNNKHKKPSSIDGKLDM